MKKVLVIFTAIALFSCEKAMLYEQELVKKNHKPPPPPPTSKTVTVDFSAFAASPDYYGNVAFIGKQGQGKYTFTFDSTGWIKTQTLPNGLYTIDFSLFPGVAANGCSYTVWDTATNVLRLQLPGTGGLIADTATLSSFYGTQLTCR